MYIGRWKEEEQSRAHFDMLADDGQYLSTDGDNLGCLAVLELEVGVDQPHHRSVVVTRTLL